MLSVIPVSGARTCTKSFRCRRRLTKRQLIRHIAGCARSTIPSTTRMQSGQTHCATSWPTRWKTTSSTAMPWTVRGTPTKPSSITSSRTPWPLGRMCEHTLIIRQERSAKSSRRLSVAYGVLTGIAQRAAVGRLASYDFLFKELSSSANSNWDQAAEYLERVG